MRNRVQAETLEERLIDFGFDSLEIERARQVLLRRRECTYFRPDRAKPLPFVDLRSDANMVERGPYYWRNWIVENLYQDHNASWTRLLADGQRKRIERKENSR